MDALPVRLWAAHRRPACPRHRARPSARTARAILVALVALALAAPALASERQPTPGEIEHEVMCPTCKTLLELSHAPVAERMRSFIRARIAAGDTKSEIETKLVAEFGEAVLAAPPRRGFGLLAWLLPLAGILAAASAIALIARRWREGAGDQPPLVPEGVSLDPALERRLDEELARYDR